MHDSDYVSYTRAFGKPALAAMVSTLGGFIFFNRFPYKDGIEPFMRFQRRSYTDTVLLDKEFELLEELVAASEDKAGRVIALLIPDLSDPCSSYRGSTSRIEKYFMRRGIPVIDCSRSLDSIPLSQRVVNPYDSHASEEANRVIARLIYDRLE